MRPQLPTQEIKEIKFPGNESFLLANSEAYEWLVQKISLMDKRSNAEAVLSYLKKAASFAISYHSGRFADGAIENLALEIGERLPDHLTHNENVLPTVTQKVNNRQVMHVTTRVLEIGGHTRMMYHWILNDSSSCHSVVLVDQGDMPIPFWLSEAVQISGGSLITFHQGDLICDKALRLRRIARQSADLIILHHFGADVVPTVAFATNHCPPVVVLNHADHEFWMGSSVADMVISLRTAGAECTLERRFVSCNQVLPIPLYDNCEEISRTDARRTLGIGMEQVMLLSIGRAEKYRPYGSYSFVETANKILEQNSSAHLYVVGESSAGIVPYLRCAIHERLHFVGVVEFPSLYRAAADVYLESFPFGSQTALLEAALSGLPVVPAYAPLHPLLVANDDALIGVLSNPHDEDEYIERVKLMIRCPDMRVKLGEELRKRLLVDHVGEGWRSSLMALYQKTDILKHRARPIPVTTCNVIETDINLSLWHVVADGRTYTTGVQEDRIETLLRHSAYVAKVVGNYEKARLLSFRAIWHNPFKLASWRLLAVSLLGRSGQSIRRMFLGFK